MANAFFFLFLESRNSRCSSPLEYLSIFLIQKVISRANVWPNHLRGHVNTANEGIIDEELTIVTTEAG